MVHLSIHVVDCYIVNGKCIGKYTIHGSCGIVLFRPISYHFASFVSCDNLIWALWIWFQLNLLVIQLLESYFIWDDTGKTCIFTGKKIIYTGKNNRPRGPKNKIIRLAGLVLLVLLSCGPLVPWSPYPLVLCSGGRSGSNSSSSRRSSNSRSGSKAWHGQDACEHLVWLIFFEGPELKPLPHVEFVIFFFWGSSLQYYIRYYNYARIQ